MSDTPRTNARVKRMIDNGQSPEGLEYWARDLERELNAANDKIKRLEEALVKITKEVPSHDGCGELFRPMFDGDGNEIGVQPVDPIKVIGAMHARALDAISCQCA